MNNTALSNRSIRTPQQYFCWVLTIIFAAEAAVMYLLPLILPADVDPNFEAFCDAGILTVFSAPLLWAVMIRPLRLVASEESAKYARIVQDASDGIVTVDEQGRIRSLNPAAENLLRTTSAEVIDKELKEFIVDSSSGTPEFLRSISDSCSACATTSIRCADGAATPIELTVSKLKIKNSTQFTLIIRDITARRQAELELANANERLVESAHLAGKAEMATSVLHNVGNVLTSVNVMAVGHADRLRDSRIAGLIKAIEMLEAHEANLADFLVNDSRGQQLTKYICHAGRELQQENIDSQEEMSALRDCINHANKIVESQQEFARCRNMEEETDLARILDKAVAIAGASLQRHSVTFTTECEDIPATFVDRHKLIQVMVNLLTNAKDAVGKRDKDDRRVHVSMTMRGSDRVCISVQDNGVGLAEEQKNQIFSHGYTTKENGHGFGLHYSCLAVKELGGKMSVRSDGPGRGSEFLVELPLKLAQHEVV
ncbi:MAG: PAS domain S-box protein [Planctomycetales bacterium]|nr:PAS domain S-box protein [Planctomycetales bacterium]